jgi:predicted transcriptional regulator of viral defense system
MKIATGNNTPIIRVFVLREMQRRFGQREFTFTDARNIHSIYGCDKHNIADEFCRAGLIERVRRGRYVITDNSIKMLAQCREVFV